MTLWGVCRDFSHDLSGIGISFQSVAVSCCVLFFSLSDAVDAVDFVGSVGSADLAGSIDFVVGLA